MLPTRSHAALTEQERAWLRTLVGQSVASPRLLTHALILRTADGGEAGPGSTDEAIAGALAAGRATVVRVRPRYV